MLDKSQILAKDTLKRKKIAVKEWGGEVFITEFTVAEYNKINSMLMGDLEIRNEEQKIPLTIDKFADVKVETISLGIVNEDGSKMFTRQEVEELRGNTDTLDFLYGAITELNNPKKS